MSAGITALVALVATALVPLNLQAANATGAMSTDYEVVSRANFSSSSATTTQLFEISLDSDTTYADFHEELSKPQGAVADCFYVGDFTRDGIDPTTIGVLASPSQGIPLTAIECPDGIYQYQVEILDAAGTPFYAVLRILLGQEVPLSMDFKFPDVYRSKTLKINLSTGVSPNASINWGDGTSNTVARVNDIYSHTYATDGTYTVTITGLINNIGLPSNANEMYFVALTKLNAWGTGILEPAGFFTDAISLESFPIELPARFTDTSYMFYNANITPAMQKVVANWDMSSIKIASGMFWNSAFNEDLSAWDLSAIDPNYTNFFEYSGGLTDIFHGTSGDSAISKENYSKTLIGWALKASTWAQGITLSSASQGYCREASPARTALADTYGWLITDGGEKNCLPTTTQITDDVSGAVEQYGATSLVVSITGNSDPLTTPTGTIDWLYCFSGTSFEDIDSASCLQKDISNSIGYTLPTTYLRKITEDSPGLAKAFFKVETSPIKLDWGSGYYRLFAKYSGDGTYAGTISEHDIRVGGSSGGAQAPGSPATPTATAGDGSATVQWSAPTTGGTPTSYAVTSNPAGANCMVTGTSALCAGLVNGTAYTFSVVATNTSGSSAASLSSAPVTPSAAGGGGQAPGTPAIPSATAGNRSATIRWVLPTGGTPTSYTVTSTPGGNTCTVNFPALSCTISGLTNGTAYSFSVVARNDSGSSSSSPESAMVTPSSAGAGNNGGTGGGSYFGSVPAVPIASAVKVTPGNGSVSVAVTYSGDRNSEPTSYVVKAMPGGNTCLITGTNSGCEILGLQSGVDYTISMQAQNSLGNSAALIIASIRTLNSAGSNSALSVKSLWGFAGDSARLTAAHKKSIRSYLAANKKISQITCTGFTAGKRVLKSDKALAHARAMAVCGYVQIVRPLISTTIIGKTPGLPWGAKNRKVDLKAFQVGK